MPNQTADKERLYLSRRTKFEFRDGAEGENGTLEGYFVVFNQPYYIDEYMEEIILPTAFDERTDTSDVRGLVDHVPHLVLGRSTSDTLSFSLDEKGLFARIKVNSQDSDAVNLYSRVQRGDVDQASFGFDEDEVVYEDLPGGRIRRTIRHISKLWEISVCTFPAYEQTCVAARSRLMDDARQHALAAKKENLKRRFRHHA